jgi:DNA polymerase (family 10)
MRGETTAVENAAIAAQLEAFAGLLELADASPYSARAYRRAAELIRSTPAPVNELVRSDRVRELRGIGPGIEARLRELVETGEIAALEELERELAPDLIGLGRYLGVGARRMVEIGRALDVRTVEELREAAAEGRLAQVPGIGPKTEAKLRAALAKHGPATETRPVLLSRALALLRDVAEAIGGEPAGDARRFHDEPRHLAVVCASERPAELIAGFGQLPQVVTLVEWEERRAVGVTVEGVPIELLIPPPERFGTELVRATGSAAYVAALEPLPEAPTEEEVYRALGVPYCPPELREQAFGGEPPRLVELTDLRGDLHCHTTWSDGRASVEEMGRAARERGYDYLAICDHTPNVRVVPGLGPDEVRRQAEEIAAANERLAPFRILRGIECDILPDGRLDLPDSVLSELDWVQASLHAGQRRRRDELTKQVAEAMRNPYVRALSHPTGRYVNRRPPNALDLETVVEVALETGVALEVNGLPDRLDLHGEHVRLAVEAGAPIVVSTDAHSIGGLGNIELALRTARRGWATAADIVNTRPLKDLSKTR